MCLIYIIFACIKSDMQELLVSKNKDQAFMLEDLVKWKAQIEESLKLTLGSWKGMQVCQQ